MRELTVVEAKELIRKNRNNPRFVILDVRTPEEFTEEYLPGALNIDIYADDFEEKIAGLDRMGTYLVYCKSGGRSRAAVELMEELGFRNVYNGVGWMF